MSGTTMLSKQDAIFKARLQVVILCPVFLECVSTSLSPATSLGSLLQPGHVLAMLLGVTDDAVTLQHRAGQCTQIVNSVFCNFSQQIMNRLLLLEVQ